MAKRGHTEEEILRVLREAEGGETVVEVCRKHGISQQSFYLWQKKYAGLGLSELRELRQLREENGEEQSNQPQALVVFTDLDGPFPDAPIHGSSPSVGELYSSPAAEGNRYERF
jgi:putative transposase